MAGSRDQDEIRRRNAHGAAQHGKLGGPAGASPVGVPPEGRIDRPVDELRQAAHRRTRRVDLQPARRH